MTASEAPGRNEPYGRFVGLSLMTTRSEPAMPTPLEAPFPRI